MMSRCYRKSCSSYVNYGGKGITVCKRWHRFSAFLADMGIAPVGYSIERSSNKIGYRPSNCRWLPQSEQNRNHSRNKIIKFRGQKKILSDWAKEIGLHKNTLSYRLQHYPVAVALTAPSTQGKRIAL